MQLIECGLELLSIFAGAFKHFAKLQESVKYSNTLRSKHIHDNIILYYSGIEYISGRATTRLSPYGITRGTWL